MLHYQKRKVEVGKTLSYAIPIAAAFVLSFGNDILSWHYIEENNLEDVSVVKSTMMTSNIYLVVGLIVTILVSNLIFRQIIRQEIVNPLEKLRTAIQEMRDGNLDYRIPYTDEESLYEVYEDFNDLIAETQRLSITANDLDKERKELFVSISHDIRSPLTSIVAYVQGLIDGVARNEEMRQRYLNTIKTKALDIDRMVDRLFTFAKLDADKFDEHVEIFSVKDKMEEIVEELQPQLETSNYSVDFTCKSDGKIEVNPDLFNRVCINIIENSIKYNDKQNGRLHIEVKAGEQNMRIRFSDNGPGVKDEEIPYLFDIMYRGDQARSTPAKGSGIGLSIVKKAIEGMNGHVSVFNGKQAGLITTIRIPRVIEGD